VLLKDDRARVPTIIQDIEHEEDEKTSSGIRCPLCGWRPTASSLWCCDTGGTPEPPFDGCGMIWNTFSTRGRCPRCGHQWRWTSCLACHRPSLHVDWYEEKNKRQ
jgi:DNA-directed RNA polymerase subunit RPC12/RpoP